MAITSSGIGSGLDVNTIVTQLMNAERGPITALKTRQASYNAKLSAFGTLKSTISTFQTALKALNSTALAARTATSGTPATLGASAGADAVPGSYAIAVTQLAQSHKLASTGHTDATALLGAGTMSIKVGNKTAIDIPAGDYSLKGLSSAINAANAGVSATIINDGSVNRLVITANDSGTANQVTITGTGGLDQFKFDPDPLAGVSSVMSSQAALDAKFTIDNIPIVKSSNTVTDAISGVTLNLLQLGTSTVGVATDKAAAKTAVTAFVEAYNKLNTSVKSMTSYNAATKTGAVLNGESGATAIVTALRKEMSTPVAGSGSLATLSDIGVTFQRDGTLAVDDTKLQKALDGNFANFSTLFSGADGYATRLTTLTTDMLGAKGIITSRTEGLNTTIKQIVARQAEMETRLLQTEKRYRAQFTALDTMMSSMQSTSSFLSQQLSALANNN